jgi:hypothetical protein
LRITASSAPDDTIERGQATGRLRLDTYGPRKKKGGEIAPAAPISKVRSF